MPVLQFIPPVLQCIPPVVRKVHKNSARELQQRRKKRETSGFVISGALPTAPEVQPLMHQIFSLGSCFRDILRLLNVKTIRGFTSTFVDICSATTHPFGFTYRSKIPPLDIPKFIVTTLMNQDKKCSFIRFYEDVSLKRSS